MYCGYNNIDIHVQTNVGIHTAIAASGLRALVQSHVHIAMCRVSPHMHTYIHDVLRTAMLELGESHMQGPSVWGVCREHFTLPNLCQNPPKNLPKASTGRHCPVRGSPGAAEAAPSNWITLQMAVGQNMYPKWNPGKWKHGPKPAVPWWLNFENCTLAAAHPETKHWAKAASSDHATVPLCHFDSEMRAIGHGSRGVYSMCVTVQVIFADADLGSPRV